MVVDKLFVNITISLTIISSLSAPSLRLCLDSNRQAKDTFAFGAYLILTGCVCSARNHLMENCELCSLDPAVGGFVVMRMNYLPFLRTYSFALDLGQMVKSLLIS